MSGFHINRPVEIGLLPTTRAILQKPIEERQKYERKDNGIGTTTFLRCFTSTTTWETVASLVARARQIDPAIHDMTIRVTLCELVRKGLFEKQCGGRGVPTMYRRLGGEDVKVEPVPRKIKNRVKKLRIKRALTSKNSW